MEILIINSDALYYNNESIFIDKNTGQFFTNLTNEGIKIVLFHFKIEHKNQTLADYPINKSRGIKICFTKRNHSKIIAHIKASFKLVQIIKKVDFLYLFYPNAFFYSILICLILNKPFALYLRGEKQIGSKLSHYFFRKALFVSSISPKFSHIVNKNGGNGLTIKPMIEFDINDIKPNQKKVQKEKYLLLYIGRVERDKGIFELIDAIIELKNKNVQNFKFDIIGAGEHFNIIKNKIEEYDIKDLVILNGAITDNLIIKKFYEKADLFVFPSHHEGFPRVLYEAMIFDVPIVTTFVGTIPYIMKDNYNCYKIEVNNKSNIVEKVGFILNNYPSTTKIAKNATTTVRQYLDTYNVTHEDIILKRLVNEFED